MRNTKFKHVFLSTFLSLSFIFSSLAQRTLSIASDDIRLRDALELMDKANYQAAMSSFSTFLAKNPGKGEAQTLATFYVAHCALKLNHSDAEEQLLAFGQTNAGTIYESRVFFDLGDHYFRIRNWEKSVQYFTRIPSNSLETDLQYESDYKTGVACFQLQQYDRAKSYFQKIRNREHPLSASAAYYTAYTITGTDCSMMLCLTLTGLGVRLSTKPIFLY